MNNKYLFITDQHIIKAQSVENDLVVGFDLITENFVSVKRVDCFPMPQIFKQLLNTDNHKLQYLLAQAIVSDSNEKYSNEAIAEMMNVSVRTVQRIASKL